MLTVTGRIILLLAIFTLSASAMAQRSGGGNSHRWNGTGPAWYETSCGHQGFSPSHGIPDQVKWVKPCSVPVRVCEFQRTTISYPADPDVPCETMVRPLPDGGVQKTYLLVPR